MMTHIWSKQSLALVVRTMLIVRSDREPVRSVTSVGTGMSVSGPIPESLRVTALSGGSKCLIQYLFSHMPDM